MTAFISVKNYDQQQHYKDRGPTWIKLYNRLLDDYHFALLPDACKWHLIGICLLASRHDNRIPADTEWLSRQIGAATRIDLELLEGHGFIVLEPDAEISGKPASPEKRREETEGETESMSAGADPADVFPGGRRKISYSLEFEAFWTAYPTDPLMSKKKAYENWRRLGPGDRLAAVAACVTFREFCRRHPTYRPVHAQRFLGERRFDGFNAAAPAPDAAAVAQAKDRADRLLRRGKYAPEFGLNPKQQLEKEQS